VPATDRRTTRGCRRRWLGPVSQNSTAYVRNRRGRRCSRRTECPDGPKAIEGLSAYHHVLAVSLERR
jgi:hypothetical protein